MRLSMLPSLQDSSPASQSRVHCRRRLLHAVSQCIVAAADLAAGMAAERGIAPTPPDATPLPGYGSEPNGLWHLAALGCPGGPPCLHHGSPYFPVKEAHLFTSRLLTLPSSRPQTWGLWAPAAAAHERPTPVCGRPAVPGGKARAALIPALGLTPCIQLAPPLTTVSKGKPPGTATPGQRKHSCQPLCWLASPRDGHCLANRPGRAGEAESSPFAPYSSNLPPGHSSQAST